MTTILAALGLLAFLAAVYVAYRLSRTTIGPAYIEVTETDDSFLHGDFPQPLDTEPGEYAARAQAVRHADRPSRMPLRRGNY
ncbi:hypothetical protein OG539_32575 [Actinacidiphila glaucinigra]|uniref:hypothetical protein n=1 Tax=Actinacidiphila glaucinigra TaxID=235986 RepID=UPI00324BF668